MNLQGENRPDGEHPLAYSVIIRQARAQSAAQDQVSVLSNLRWGDPASIDIGLFAVLGDVEPGSLDFGIRSEAEKRSEDEGNDRARDDRQH